MDYQSDCIAHEQINEIKRRSLRKCIKGNKFKIANFSKNNFSLSNLDVHFVLVLRVHSLSTKVLLQVVRLTIGGCGACCPRPPTKLTEALGQFREKFS